MRQASSRLTEDKIIERCVQVARGVDVTARNQLEANVFRIAGMILGHKTPLAAKRLASCSKAYFAAHPEEELHSSEVVRRGWITSMPRLNDELITRLEVSN